VAKLANDGFDPKAFLAKVAGWQDMRSQNVFLVQQKAPLDSGAFYLVS
jgi:hypothetical protein